MAERIKGHAMDDQRGKRDIGKEQAISQNNNQQTNNRRLSDLASDAPRNTGRGRRLATIKSFSSSEFDGQLSDE